MGSPGGLVRGRYASAKGSLVVRATRVAFRVPLGSACDEASASASAEAEADEAGGSSSGGGSGWRARAPSGSGDRVSRTSRAMSLHTNLFYK